MPNVLITDFDNTLYDWLQMWQASFSSMLSEVQRATGLERAELLREMRAVHQKFGTSEYAYLLEQLPSLRRFEPVYVTLSAAVDHYKEARDANLVLYPGVVSSLKELRRRGVQVVMYTESLSQYTKYRVSKLGLDDLVDLIYSPSDHELFDDEAKTRGWLPKGEIELVHAKMRFLPPGVTKPNPEVLLDIVSEVGARPADCVYVGDSLSKDVAMAQDAGILDVLAEYGAAQHHPEYGLLRLVSHWTDEAVERERTLSRRHVTPTEVIGSFSDILRLF